MGGTDVTASGIRCQSWRAQSPHEHYFQTDGWFPYEGLNAAENHCRDPDGGMWKPWCFTEDPDVRWEHCDIQLCNSMFYFILKSCLTVRLQQSFFVPMIAKFAEKYGMVSNISRRSDVRNARECSAISDS